MNKETINHLVEFVETYYANEVARLYERYPNEQTSLWIDYNDLWRFDGDIAHDVLTHTDKVTEWLEDAVRAFDVPVDMDLTELTVRVHNLPEDKIKPITALRATDTLGFFGIEGTIEQATKAKEVPQVLAYDCQKCGGAPTKIPQNDPNNLQEPYECQGCGNKGPFVINHEESEFVDEIKLNLKQPADTAPNGQGESMAVIVRDDLLEINGRHIQTYTGEKATINGQIERRQESKNSKEFVRYLNAHSIDFHNDQETVDVAEYIDDIKEEANKENCIERFAQSLVPQLYETEAWESGLLVAVAYLFGSPRIDLRENDSIDADATFRGDIHAAFIGDPGTMKSGVSRAVHQFSPQSEHRSATGLGSDVGLTATAVDNSDFSDGWTLKPGVLVRANGGHVILEEIDKTSADLEKMNDGLEGNQQITVDKAGINATLDTRVGLLVTGNPEEGRFEPNTPIPQQIDIDRSLLSRFDAIVTLEDIPDVDMDTEIAGTIGESYREAAEAEFGGRTDFDVLDRYIDPEMGRAWIKHARETITPVPTREAIDKLQTWYAEDARQLNDDAEAVVPATPRKMEVGLRFASAFARVRLSEDLTVKDAEKAIEVQKMLIGQTYDKETGQFNADKHTQGSMKDHTPGSQEERMDTVRDVLQELNPERGGVPKQEIIDACAERGMDVDKANGIVKKLKRSGDVYEPQTGEYRLV